MLSQDEPSLIATTHLKIETACTRCNVTNISIYKMHVKLKKESLQWFSLSTSCWHINEKIRLPSSGDIQKLLQLKKKTCSLKIDHDKKHPSLELHQPHEKKQRAKPNQLKFDR
jgi:hypothetical protein